MLWNQVLKLLLLHIFSNINVKIPFSGAPTYTGCPKKTMTTLSILCRTANWSSFMKEPLSRKARFGCCGVHRCGSGGSMRACHAAGPGSIPGRDKFPGWGFLRGFSSPARQMSGSFRPQGPRMSFGHHYHNHSSFITGANDLRCWRALKNLKYSV